MSDPSIEDLKRDARETLGVELSDEQAHVGRGRLPTMFDNVRLLQGWAAKLGESGPAQILQTVETPQKGNADK
jgi:hypothetical protein